jgi:hypothetical protein
MASSKGGRVANIVGAIDKMLPHAFLQVRQEAALHRHDLKQCKKRWAGLSLLDWLANGMGTIMTVVDAPHVESRHGLFDLVVPVTGSDDDPFHASHQV